MSFLNPLFLFGLAAAALPILIHLFTRRRPREQMFSSLEFLTEVNQSEIRRLRLRQWLLLLLRTLAVAALALAMSRPALKGNAGTRQGAGTTVVALVDVSGSMSAAAPGAVRAGDLVGVARRALDDLLASLVPQDELLLVPPGPHPISSQRRRLGACAAAAHALEAGAGTTDHMRAGVGARALEQPPPNRELFWISTFNRRFANAGSATTDPAPAEVAAFTAPDGPRSRARAHLSRCARGRANVAVTDAALTPSRPVPRSP